ncbi:MAG: M6 family metalloprotease domain-containing protein [bacterium]
MNFIQTYRKKIKLLFIFLIGLHGPYFAEAAYLENVPTHITQPDGTVLNCFVTGDEFYQRIHDKDNFTIVKHPDTRWYVYAVKSGDTLLATDYIFGKSNPESLGLKPFALPSPDWIQQKRTEHYRHVPKPEKKKGERTQANNTGTIQNIVIYIRFANDSEYSDDTSSYYSMFNNASGNSMYAYYREVSYNTLSIYTSFYPRPSSSIVKSFQDSHNRNYFQPYDASTNPDGYQNSSQKTSREHTLLKNAVDATSSEIPAGLNIDNDGDGYVDNVCFIIKGNTDEWSDLLWPHRWALYTLTATINSKRVWDYNFQLQNFLKSYGNGVLSHEMFHTLGAPDLYHYSQDGMDPVWRWDIMATTTTPPQHMGAWMKYAYGGWIPNIPEITSNGNYSLNPLTSSTNNAYKIASPNSLTEFFVVEYRRQSGTYETPLPGSGLLVYRIKPALNGNADGPPDEVYIYRPNGTTSERGNPESAHFSSSIGRTEINDNTNPEAFLSDGSEGGLNISNIGTAGGTISFIVGSSQGITPPTLVYPAFNAYGVPVNAVLRWNQVSGANSYNVQVSRNTDFTDLAFNQSVNNDTVVTISPNLSFSSVYYWRVNAVGSETSDWSAYRTFTTQMPAPVLNTPVNHAYRVLLADTLKWQTVAGANYYSLEVSSSSNFIPTLIQASSIGTTYYIISQGVLQNNHLYYWRVKAIKSSPYNESGWSEERDFTTIFETPVLVTPKNDSLGTALNGVLTWNSVTGATSYNVRLSDDPNYATTILNQTGITGTSLPFSGITYNKKYFWSVQAVNSNQTSLWASSFCFTTKLDAPILVSPTNNELNVELLAPLRWKKVPGGTSYYVQVAGDTNMSQTIIDNSSVSDSNLICNGLGSMIKYTWRVKAKNTDGRESDWSEKWNFTTKIGPPTLPSPPDSAEDVEVDGLLVWGSVNGATKYHLKLSKSQNFDSFVINDSNITQTSFAYNGLESNQEYYWTLRSKAGQSSSDWSPTWKFKTGLGKVVLYSPEKSSRANPLNGTLSWIQISGASSYNVMLASDVAFTNLIINQTNVTSTSIPYTNLQKNTTYYWKVSANSQSETGNWSLVWNFVTTAGEPQLITPPNNTGGVALSGTLNWRSVLGANNYTIQISDNENMSNPFFTQTRPDTFYLYSGFQNYKSYYWRVNATTNEGTSNWTETRKFTTLISNPVLYAPEHQKKDALTSGNLEWDNVEGASGYTIAISEKFDFVPKLIEEDVDGTEYEYSNLKHNQKHYWKVKALNPDANSGWSEIREFTTVLAKPELAYPVDSAIQVSVNAKLTWLSVDGYKTYAFKLAKDINFSNMVCDTSGLQFAYYDCKGLTEATRYFWKVNASNQYNTGDWSDVRTFVSYDPLDIREQESSDIIFEAYPNPFSNFVTFNIQGNIAQNVKLEIYNYAGIKVDEILLSFQTPDPRPQTPGFSYRWVAEDFTQGIYNVVLKSGNTMKTMKVVLLK